MWGFESYKKGFDASAKADTMKAEGHRYAKRIKKMDNFEQIEETCECCGLPIVGDNYEMCINVKELVELGVGFPLYF